MMRSYGEWIGGAARWGLIALVLSWMGLAVLANVDVGATARLFAAIRAGADHLARHG